jgi:50S ribosomal subunit-associated GTPase HflX
MERVSETIKNLVDTMLVAIPYSRSELVAQCHEFGVVHSVDYGPEHILVRADVARSLAGKLEEFQIV